MTASAVNGLFAALGEEPEETLAAYLVSTLQGDEALDFVELKDIIAGFSPSFDALPDSKQNGLLVQLVKQVSQAYVFKKEGLVCILVRDVACRADIKTTLQKAGR